MKSSTQDKIEGTVKNLKGKLKEKAGQATNNPNLETEGRIDQWACLENVDTNLGGFDVV